MITHTVSCEEKSWIKQILHYEDFDENKILSILYFTIIWNLFEKECCDKDAQINTHAPHIAEKYHQKINASLTTTWNYFHSRYIKKEKQTSKFFNFKFYPGDNKNFVEQTLCSGKDATEKNKLEALLRIAFRLRNNLYHGEKDVSKFYEQNENFKQINLLLISIIDASFEERNAR